MRRNSDFGQWNPEKHALPESPGIMSGDRVKLFCHSLGLGPFATFLSPPSSACAATYSDELITFGIPRNIISSEIQQLVSRYDGYKLTRAEMDAFEKMGFISTAKFAPNPTVTVTENKEFEVSASIPFVSASASTSKSTPREYTLWEKKKYLIDYKRLQDEPLRSAPLDWSKQRGELERQSLTRPETGEISQPVTLTVLFE